MLFYLALLLYILIPIGFGFGLAVYLKRKFENPTPRPETNETSSVSGGILEILKESSVAQDILLAKNKVSEEDSNQTISEVNKLDGYLQDDSDFIPVKQEISEPASSDLFAESQDELLARALESFREFSPENSENILAEPCQETVKKPEEAVSKETSPKKTTSKITKSTFENISVYEAVPEELLETHLCLDHKLSPEIYDSFAAVPDSLLNRFEIDLPAGSGHLVQTQDAAIMIRAGKKTSF